LTNGTGGVPYVLTGSLVAELDRNLYPGIYPINPQNNESDFLFIGLGTTSSLSSFPEPRPSPLR
jgi:hypothetical protein